MTPQHYVAIVRAHAALEIAKNGVREAEALVNVAMLRAGLDPTRVHRFSDELLTCEPVDQPPPPAVEP